MDSPGEKLCYWKHESDSIDFLLYSHALFLPVQCDLSIVRGSLSATPDQISRPRSTSDFIMIASDHDKIRDSLNQIHQKRPAFFDEFDFLLARLHPFYKKPSVQRATKDELYKRAEVITSLYLLVTIMRLIPVSRRCMESF